MNSPPDGVVRDTPRASVMLVALVRLGSASDVGRLINVAGCFIDVVAMVTDRSSVHAPSTSARGAFSILMPPLSRQSDVV